MAYGSLRQMRRYADKVFAKEERLGRMTDGRVDPTLPLAAVLSTWQWGLIRRTPSTEQIGDLLRGPALAGAAGPEAGSGRQSGPGGRGSGGLVDRGMERDDAGGLLPRPPGRDPDRRGSVREALRRLGSQ